MGYRFRELQEGKGRMEREREKISLVIKCPNPSVNIFSCFVNYW